jgi:hypothetical protein
MLKLLLYTLFSILMTTVAVLLLTRGPAPDSSPVIMIALVVLFGGPAFGAFWMVYMSIRYEKNPFPMIFLAMIPFTFLWFYFERVRRGKLRRYSNVA